MQQTIQVCGSWRLATQLLVARLMEGGPSKVLRGACNSTLHNCLVPIMCVRCNVLNSVVSGLWVDFA